MGAWTGGNCPDCGDFMPPNLITCQTCRAMLNSDLQVNVVEVPAYIPLPEVEASDLEKSDTDIISEPKKASEKEVLLIPARGVYYRCPGCKEELKIPKQFLDAKVQCNRCAHDFQMDVNPAMNHVAATYANCPHCKKRIRVSKEMTNHNVACMHCHGALHIQFQPS